MKSWLSDKLELHFGVYIDCACGQSLLKQFDSLPEGEQYLWDNYKKRVPLK